MVRATTLKLLHNIKVPYSGLEAANCNCLYSFMTFENALLFLIFQVEQKSHT